MGIPMSALSQQVKSSLTYWLPFIVLTLYNIKRKSGVIFVSRLQKKFPHCFGKLFLNFTFAKDNPMPVGWRYNPMPIGRPLSHSKGWLN